jgi:hypothetical protein
MEVTTKKVSLLVIYQTPSFRNRSLHARLQAAYCLKLSRFGG